jgi:histidine decarboxylase
MQLNQEILVGDNSLSAERVDNPYEIRTDNIISRPQPAVSDNSSILDSLLDDYKNHLAGKTALHAGYPYNLSFSYEKLSPFFEFAINNLGDPFVASNYKIDSRFFEQEALAFFAKLYQMQDCWGYITTCGTEGNLYGLLLGRETYPDGILYASNDSHYSIAKAARFFKIPHVVVNSQPNGEMDYVDFLSRLDSSRPAIVNLNAGTTLKGAVDDLELILEMLERKGIKNFYIHCDGALGGMLVPYLAPGKINFNWPIHSLAISGHKFIGCPFPCGIVLTHKKLVDKLATNIEYIGSKDTTLGGSRNGHAPLFLWYAIQQRKHLFQLEAETCASKAADLRERLERVGISCLLNSYSSTVVFPKPSNTVVEKWQLSTQGDLAHVVVMQNHSDELLERFVADYLESHYEHLSAQVLSATV